MTDYRIFENFTNGSFVIITGDQYDELVKVKGVIKILWAIEDAFSLFASSFLELEEYLLHLGVRYMYGSQISRSADHFFDDSHHGVNLKLLTLLSAATAYVDQVKKRISELKRLTGGNWDVKSVFSSAFDRHLEYRVMDALRNIAAHRYLPMGSISFGASNNASGTSDQSSEVRVTVSPRLISADFVSDNRARPQTRDEVDRLGVTHLDLKFLVRGYVAALWECHQKIKELTAEHL